MVAEGPDRTAVTGFFDADAPNWDSVYRRADVFGIIHQLRREICLRWVAERAPLGAALEVGCGTGQTAILLDSLGHYVTATDSAPEMLKRAAANTRAAGAGGRIRLQQADAHALPFPDGTFDLVVALGVIPWLEQPATGVAEMARVLAPGGLLVVNCDNRHRLQVLLDPRYSPAFRRLREAIRPPHRAGSLANVPGAVRHSPAEFDALLTRCGLLVERRSGFGFGPFTLGGRPLLPDRMGVWLHHVLQRLADFGFRPAARTGSQYMVLARRP